MTDRLLETYIQMKLMKGGKKDTKAAGYARQLLEMFGDELIPDRSSGFDVSEYDELRSFEARGGRLVVLKQFEPSYLSPTELRFLHPLVDFQGRVIPDEHLRRAVSPEDPISQQYLRTLFDRVRDKVEDDPQDPKYLLRLNSRGTVAIGLDRKSFMDFVHNNPRMFNLPVNL